MTTCGRTTAAATASACRRWDVLHKYGADYKLIFVGDATMSPYEILQPGGSRRTLERGSRRRLDAAHARHLAARRLAQPASPSEHWDYTPSIQMIRQLIGDRMFPLTLDGLERAMRALSR